MANKISVVIDATTDKAVASLKSFRTSIADADGAAGKLKAGFTGAMGAVKANAGTAALAAGTALVAFGVKAAGAFTDVALAADDAAKSTGLTVDQASRFIAVGDDYGITAEDIAKGLGKVTTTLDAAKWEKYGIATRDAAGVARDANSIILDTFDALSKETNATERANMAKELLGKGYQTLSPLIGKTREELEGYLGAVSDSQVITAKEAEKARKLALAQDALSDAYLDVQLAVGSLVAELGPAIEHTADMASKAAELVDKLGPLPEIMLALVAPVTQVSRVMGMFSDDIDLSTITLADLETQLKANGFTTEQIADITAEWAKVNKSVATTIDGVTIPAVDSLTDSTELTRQAAEKLDRQWDELKGEISDERAFLDMEQTFVDLRAAAEEAYIAAASGADDAAEKQRTYRNAVLDAREQVIEFGANVLNLPTSHVTALQLLADQGQFDELEQRLAILTRNRTMSVSLIAKGALGYDSSDAPFPGGRDGKVSTPWPMADGGIVMPRPGGTPAILGEAGRPEAVIPLNRAGGMLANTGGSTTVNIYTNADPNSTKAALRRFDRRNGPGI